VFLLWLASMPITAGIAARTLETQFTAQKVETYPMADVVIVLGGGVSVPNAYNPYPDLGSAGDRVLHAYRIMKAGKARKIIVSGGLTFDPDAAYAEANAMADLLITLGIDRNLIITEGRSRTTYENAVFSKPIWTEQNFSSGLLVTSGFHMPRALAVFRTAGFADSPAITDVTINDGQLPFPLNILPDATSLAVTSNVLKEWLGLYIYRLRGWA
jgi:uncharacterized SAM-binding protein YcdF (DUF218 family)